MSEAEEQGSTVRLSTTTKSEQEKQDSVIFPRYIKSGVICTNTVQINAAEPGSYPPIIREPDCRSGVARKICNLEVSKMTRQE